MMSHRLLQMDDLSDSADAAVAAAGVEVTALCFSFSVCFFFFLKFN